MWTLDIASGDLSFFDTKVGRLNHSETLVLSCLISNHGLLVSKDLLLDTGWPGKFVSPNSLTAAIKNIRQLLSFVESDIFIETVHRKGYILKGYNDDIKLIEIVPSAQVRLSDPLIEDTNAFVESEAKSVALHPLPDIQTNNWKQLKSNSRRCIGGMLNLFFISYFLVTIFIAFFVAFKPASLYCYQIGKAEFCGLFELNIAEQESFISKYGKNEGKYYYGYDEALDEIKVYFAN